MTTVVRELDPSELKQRVQRIYEEVALEPEREFHFETGRPLAERLDYPGATRIGSRQQRSTRSPASAIPSTSPRCSPARRCSISVAVRGWTGSSPSTGSAPTAR
jgi:hypothetical protein